MNDSEEPRTEAKEPLSASFLAMPYFHVVSPAPRKPEPSRDELAGRLKARLQEIHQLCRATDDPIGKGPIRWPSRALLDGFSNDIQSLASLYGRGRGTTWACIKTVGNKRPALKLRNRIEALVERATKLYPEPLAITIQKHGIAGNEAAKKCFEALEKCRRGQIGIASVKWGDHREILKPRSCESCEAKAAQICIDWLRSNSPIEKPWSPLAFWLAVIGNSSLAASLTSPPSAKAFDAIRAENEKRRDKESNAKRQRKSRLRKRIDANQRKIKALRHKEYELRHKEYELVRQELGIIDSADSTESGRDAAAKRLMRYTERKPDEWRKFFVKKA